MQNGVICRGVPWAKFVEENTTLIKSEYDALIASKKPSDYELQQDEHTVSPYALLLSRLKLWHSPTSSQLHAGQWDWHSFVSAGHVQEDFVKWA